MELVKAVFFELLPSKPTSGYMVLQKFVFIIDSCAIGLNDPTVSLQDVVVL